MHHADYYSYHIHAVSEKELNTEAKHCTNMLTREEKSQVATDA